MEPTGLVTVLPHFSYRAVDASGIVENEFCPVMLGRIEADRLRVDPEEVAESRWVGWQELHRMVYAIAILGVAHYLWLVKRVALLDPILYAIALAILLGWRIQARLRLAGPWPVHNTPTVVQPVVFMPRPSKRQKPKV